MRRRCAWALAALLVAPAVAAQTADDRALIEAGRALRRAGRNAAALEAFREAYTLRPTPEAAGQIGFAEHALGHWTQAAQFLRSALGAAADPWVVTQRRALEFSLQEVERHFGSLFVESNPPGARLTVAGATRALPMTGPVQLEAGTTAVEIHAEGFRTDRREVTVAAGETVRLVVQLAAVGGAPVVEVGPGPRPLGSDALVVRSPGTPPQGRALPPSQGGVTRALAWVSLGVAAASLGGGAIAMVVRDGAAGRWNDDARCLAGGRTREENCSDDRATASTAHDLMIAGYAAGGVLAVGAVVLFVASPSRERAVETPRVSFGVGPGGVTVGGRF